MVLQLARRKRSEVAVFDNLSFLPGCLGPSFSRVHLKYACSSRRVCCAARRRMRVQMCTAEEQEDDAIRRLGDDMSEEVSEDMPVELADGFLEGTKVRPKLDIEVDEYMLMWKLRKMLHEDDFRRIFDSSQRRIGEI